MIFFSLFRKKIREKEAPIFKIRQRFWSKIHYIWKSNVNRNAYKDSNWFQRPQYQDEKLILWEKKIMIRLKCHPWWRSHSSFANRQIFHFLKWYNLPIEPIKIDFLYILVRGWCSYPNHFLQISEDFSSQCCDYLFFFLFFSVY